MRPTFSSIFLFLFFTLFNSIANAYITLYSWPTLAYTGKTYTIGWSGGDGTPITVSLLLGGSSTTLTNLGTIWTGTGYSIYWTVGTALKASNYYAIKISQSGYVDYSDYFTILDSISGTTLASSSTIKGTSLSSVQSVFTSISTQISSVPTTVTKVSTVAPTSTSSDSQPFSFGLGSSSTAPFPSNASSIASLYPTALSTISISTTSFSTVTPSSCTSPTTTGLLSRSSDCQGSHLSHTTIIGIIVGAIIAVIAILGGIILVVRRSMNKHDAVRVEEKPDLSSGTTPGPSAPAPMSNPTPPSVGAYAAAPNYEQKQHPGPSTNVHDQQFSNQYQQQQYQQPYQPYQHQQPYQPPYQQYQYQPYQQQQQQPYPPQQYPPPHPYHQTHPPSMESHELTALQDTKRPDVMTVNSPTSASAISPATTYSNLHNNTGQGTSISDRASEMDTTILPRYEKETPLVSVQAVQPGHQQQQQPPLQPQPFDGRTPNHGHGPVYELG